METTATDTARDYIEADIEWLTKSPAAWLKVAEEIHAFGEALESASVLKHAKSMKAFVACMGPVLAALLAWKAAPSLELGLAAKKSAVPMFAAAKKLSSGPEFDSEEFYGSKRLVRLHKAVQKLSDLGENSILAQCLNDGMPIADWSEDSYTGGCFAVAAIYEPEVDEVDDDESEVDAA